MTEGALTITGASEVLTAPASTFDWFDIRAESSSWDELARRGEQPMFHLAPLLRAHEHGSGKPAGVTLRAPGGRRIAIGGLLRKVDGGRCFETLSFPPLAETDAPELVRSLASWLDAQGFAEVRFGSYAGGVEDYRLPLQGALTRQRLEYLWDVSAPSDARYRAIRSNHKRKLQKLLKQQLVLKKIDRFQAEQMTWMRIQWARRRELSLGYRRVLEIYRYHHTLRRTLSRPGVAHLYGIYDTADNLLSLAYMLEVGETAFYMIGASSPAGYQMNASLRLFWELGESYNARGFKVVNLGGAPVEALSEDHEEHGVMRFKAGFGIEPISRVSLTIKK